MSSSEVCSYFLAILSLCSSEQASAVAALFVSGVTVDGGHHCVTATVTASFSGGIVVAGGPRK